MIKKIKQLSNNRDAKVLFENFISLSVLKVIGYIFPLITLPYLARVIGVAGFGEIAIAASVIVYFVTITEYGFAYTSTREIAKNREDINKVSEIFSAVLFAKIFLLIISALILLICTYTIPFFEAKKELLWLSFLCVPGHIIFPDWFFQAQEKMKYITILNVLLKLIFTLLVFIVIKEPSDYIYQPVLIAIGTFTSGAVAFAIIIHKFKVRIVYIPFSYICDMIKNGWNIFISLLFPNLYTNFSTILLGYFGGTLETGIFSTGKTFIELSDQISGVLSRTFYPYLARNIGKHNLYVKISGVICVFMSLFLFAFAGILVDIFYTSEFTSAIIVIRIMAICPIALFLMNTYGTNYLVLVGEEKLYRKIVVYNSLFGFFLSYFCVKEWGYIGAAITITMVWILRGLSTWFFARKIMNKKIL